MKFKLVLIAGLVIAASGCVSLSAPTADNSPPISTYEFKGGATADYRQLPGMTWVAKPIAVKSQCEVSSIRKQGNAIYLDC